MKKQEPSPIEEVKHAQITVLIKGGQGQNDFYSLQDLKEWLDKHPGIAAKLGV